MGQTGGHDIEEYKVSTLAQESPSMRPVMFTGASKAVGRCLKPLTPTVLCERTGWLSSSEFTFNYTSLRDRPTRDGRISYDNIMYNVWG